MGIKICKTYDITDSEWTEIVQGFSKSFDRPTTVFQKRNFYTNNLFGFSYHALAFNQEGTLIGHTTIIPSYYKVYDNLQIIGLSSGTFILKSYRNNVTLLKEMHNGLRNICINENVTAIVGVPNNNAFQYTIKVLNKCFLGYLNYYFLPLRIANLYNKKLPSFFNFLSLSFFKIYVLLFLGLSYLINRQEEKSLITLDLSPNYLKKRFKTGYNLFVNNGVSCYFKIDTDESKRIAYILEFNNNGIPDLKSLSYSLWHILSVFKVDAIAYIGTLRMRPKLLIKIPHSLEPKHFPLTCELLTSNGDLDKKEYLNFNNWKFSLIDFDVK